MHSMEKGLPPYDGGKARTGKTVHTNTTPLVDSHPHLSTTTPTDTELSREATNIITSTTTDTLKTSINTAAPPTVTVAPPDADQLMRAGPAYPQTELTSEETHITQRPDRSSVSTQRQVSILDVLDVSSDLKNGASILDILRSQFETSPPSLILSSETDLNPKSMLTEAESNSIATWSFLSPFQLLDTLRLRNVNVGHNIMHSQAATIDKLLQYEGDGDYPLPESHHIQNDSRLLPHHIQNDSRLLPHHIQNDSRLLLHHIQNDSRLLPHHIQNDSRLLPHHIQNDSRLLPHHIQNDSRLLPHHVQNDSRLLSHHIQNDTRLLPHHIQNDSRLLPHHIQNDSRLLPHHIQNDSRLLPHLASQVFIESNFTADFHIQTTPGVASDETYGSYHQNQKDYSIIPEASETNSSSVFSSDDRKQENKKTTRLNIEQNSISSIDNRSYEERNSSYIKASIINSSLSTDSILTDVSGSVKDIPAVNSGHKVKILDKRIRQEMVSSQGEGISPDNELFRKVQVQNESRLFHDNPPGLYDPTLYDLIDKLPEQDRYLKGNEIVPRHGEIPFETISSLPRELEFTRVTSDFPRLHTSPAKQNNSRLTENSNNDNSSVSIDRKYRRLQSATQGADVKVGENRGKPDSADISPDNFHGKARTQHGMQTENTQSGNPRDITPGSTPKAVKSKISKRPGQAEDSILDYILQRGSRVAASRDPRLTGGPTGTNRSAGVAEGKESSIEQSSGMRLDMVASGSVKAAGRTNNRSRVVQGNSDPNSAREDLPSHWTNTSDEDLLSTVLKRPHILIPLQPPVTDFLYELSLAERQPQVPAPPLSPSTSSHTSSFLVSSPPLSPPSPSSSVSNKGRLPIRENLDAAPRTRLRCRFQCFYYRENPETGDWLDELRRRVQESSKRPDTSGHTEGATAGHSDSLVTSNSGVGAKNLQYIRSRLRGRGYQKAPSN